MTLHDDFAAEVLAQNPEAYWTFQGLAPGALHDMTGNGHELTAFGAPTFANPVAGWDGFEALMLNGATDYLTAALSTPLRPKPFTFGAVVSALAGSGILAGTQPSALTTGWDVGVGDAGHNFSPFCRIGTGGGAVNTPTTTPIGQYGSGALLWLSVYDGVSLTQWINGNVIGSVVATTFNAGSQTFTIGRYTDAASAFFQGLISDMFFIPGAMANAEVGKIMSLTPVPANPSAQVINAQLAAILDAVTIRAY